MNFFKRLLGKEVSVEPKKKNVSSNKDAEGTLGGSLNKLFLAYQPDRLILLNKFYSLFNKYSDSEILIFRINKLLVEYTEILIEKKNVLDKDMELGPEKVDEILKGAWLIVKIRERDYREDRELINKIKTELEIYETYKEKTNIESVKQNIWEILEYTKEEKSLKS